MDYKIYLATQGKTHGPFTPEEFERIRSGGEIAKYDAIFDSRTGAWQPLSVPQAPSSVSPPMPAPVAAPTPRISAPSPSASIRVIPVEAVCHNYRSVVSGRLSRVTETGCDLISTQSGAGPSFAERGQVFLNLLDTSTGRTMDVSAHLVSVLRASDGAWTYRLEWPSCPELVLAG